MCKLYGMTTSQKFTRRQMDAVTRAIHRSFASSQRDGFGFTAANIDGTRYSERYTTPAQFAGIGRAHTAKKRLPDALKSAVDVDATGTLDAAGITSLIIHGRTSTNDITLANTQPLSKAGWSLAHNGVVDWQGHPYPCDTTNDSEHLLNMFALGRGLAELEDVRGYAALLMLDNAGNFLAFKDSRAPLHFAQIKNGFVIATTPDDITIAMRAAKIKAPYIASVPDNVLLTFAQDGSVTSTPHAGIQSAYSLQAAAATAFGGSYYHTSTPTGRDTTTRRAAKTSDLLPRQLDLDAMDEETWRAYATGTDTDGDRGTASTPSIHNMTDEELTRYGVI